MVVNAGFYETDKGRIDEFCTEYLRSVSKCDALVCWFTIGEDYLIRKYNRMANLIPFASNQPYLFPDEPWSKALRGKRVLVVSPFSESIEAQYKKRELLFPNTDVLPEFELYTIKAVQTRGALIDSRFKTWFDALDYMKAQIRNSDFDVAIVGCGAYSLPLCAYVKDIGKIAIQMAGATQLLFGLRGNRWEIEPRISCLFNDAWVRPSLSENPAEANVADNPYA